MPYELDYAIKAIELLEESAATGRDYAREYLLALADKLLQANERVEINRTCRRRSARDHYQDRSGAHGAA